MIESEAYIYGKDAGYDSYTPDDNPYTKGTYNYEEWEDGRLSSIGERREPMPNAKLRGAADED